MTKRLSVALLLAALLGLSQCKNADPDPASQLSPATQTGANTGGCLINGEPFVATGRGGSLLTNPIPPLSGGFYEDSLYYLTLAGRSSKGSTSVYLFFRSQLLGIYLFNQTTPSLDRAGLRYTLRYAACSFSDTKELYITDNQHTGQVIISKADVARAISAGTFEFTAASTADPSKTVTITSGRFDRKQ